MRVGLLLLSPLLVALLSLAVPETSAAAGQPLRDPLRAADGSELRPSLPGPLLVAAQPTEPPGEPMLLNTPGTPETPGAPESTGDPAQPTAPAVPEPEAEVENMAEVRGTTTDPTPPPAPGDEGEGGLPITGAQVGGMVLLGTGMVAGGFAMLAVRRRRTPADLLSGS